jgi:aldose 1-epimerase
VKDSSPESGPPTRADLLRSGLLTVLALSSFLFLLGIGCKARHHNFAPDDTVEVQKTLLGGQEAVVLTRTQTNDGLLPEFLSATLLPGRGMNIFQITAYLPGQGDTSLLQSPTLAEASAQLNGHGADLNGALNYSMGGAILLPYANRVTGRPTPDGSFIQTAWGRHALTLPSSGAGQDTAIHGLFNTLIADSVDTEQMPDGQLATGNFHAGNFGGRWPSSTDVTVTVSLSRRNMDITVTARNIGNEAEPMGIGWHPYFVIPSGDRRQAQLKLPPGMQAESDNHHIPTGRLLQTSGTGNDFTQHNGRALGSQSLDDSFVRMHSNALDNGPMVELRDPEAQYGLRITALSTTIKAFQIYAPADKNFIAIEPQMNFNDPFGKQWLNEDTGMATLAPGQSVQWKVRIELFVPSHLDVISSN